MMHNVRKMSQSAFENAVPYNLSSALNEDSFQQDEQAFPGNEYDPREASGQFEGEMVAQQQQSVCVACCACPVAYPVFASLTVLSFLGG
jgi:hypothetical protein